MMMEEKKVEGVDLSEPQDLVKPGTDRFNKLPVVDQARVFLL